VRAYLAIPLLAAILLAASPPFAQEKPLPAALTPAPWPRFVPPAPEPYPTGLGPRVMPWTESDPIPPGYHEGRRIRLGLLIAGVSVLGSFWLPTCVIGSFSDDAVTTIEGCTPVVGPFALIGQAGSTGASGAGGEVAALIADGVIQLGGLGMMVAGIMGERVLLRADVRAARSWWAPVPLRLGSRGAGLGLVGAL
jgi:hypothetical protein